MSKWDGKLLQIGIFFIYWTGSWGFYKWPAYCGCKIWQIGPFELTWLGDECKEYEDDGSE